jgi:hypothetical protein
MEILEELLQSKAFREWSPAGKVSPHKEHLKVSRPPFDHWDKTGNKNTLVDEKHYSPADLASAWSFDVETVRNIFRDEPGVLKLGKSAKHTRAYTTLRIPESVAVRVHKRLSE